MKRTTKQQAKTNRIALAVANAANEGHYTDRLTGMAKALGSNRILQMCHGVNALYAAMECKPSGIDSVLCEISRYIIWECQSLEFSQDQMNAIGWGIYDIDICTEYGIQRQTGDDKARTNQ